jgi:hypothetical protein
MGTTPGCSTKDNLDLLTAREASHGVMGNKFRLQAKVSEVLLDLTANEGTKKTKTLSFASVNFEDFL